MLQQNAKFIFWQNLLKRSKIEKMNITIKLYIFKLTYIPNFVLNWLFWIVGPNLHRKGISDQKKFFFRPNLLKKGSYFQSKTDKIYTSIEFSTFKLVFVSNFTFSKQVWIFGRNLPEKDIYGQKQKKGILSLNSAYSN